MHRTKTICPHVFLWAAFLRYGFIFSANRIRTAVLHFDIFMCISRMPFSCVLFTATQFSRIYLLSGYPQMLAQLFSSPRGNRMHTRATQRLHTDTLARLLQTYGSNHLSTFAHTLSLLPLTSSEPDVHFRFLERKKFAAN